MFNRSIFNFFPVEALWHQFDRIGWGLALLMVHIYFVWQWGWILIFGGGFDRNAGLSDYSLFAARFDDIR